MIRWWAWTLPLVLVATAAAQGSRRWPPDDRVVISDFSVVDAVAAGDQRVYAATRNGLGLYDWRMRRWEPPLTAVDGYPRERVRAALADPADGAVWLATDAGLVRFRPLSREFESIIVAGGVRAMVYDRDDPFRGMWVRTVEGWAFLARGSFFPQPGEPLPPSGRRAGSLSVEALMARAPVADAMRSAVLLDDRLRRFNYTGATEVPFTSEFFIGTDGLGVLRFDALMAQFDRLSFGLLARGAGSLVVVPDGVWVGTDHRSRRSGLTFVSDDLQRYAYREGPRATGLGITGVRALLGRGSEIWAATDRGVIRFAADGSSRAISRLDGLPDDETFALAQGPSGVWAGTAFGLAFVRDDGVVRDVGPAGPIPVLALSAARDTVWVGTTEGLGMATPTGDLLVPPDVAEVPELKSAIVAITHVADTIVAASVDRLLWKAPRQRWQIEGLVRDAVGTVFALAPDSGGVWVGGQLGIAFFRFATKEVRAYRVPGDVPGPVHDLAVSGRYLWVATEEGLVRFRRHALFP